MIKKLTKQSNQQGFTLVEVMIAVVFMTVLLIAATTAIISVLASFREIKSQDFVQRQAVYMQQVMQRRSSEATRISTSMGDNFSWEVGPDYKTGPNGGRDLEAICFDNTGFVFAHSVRGAESKPGFNPPTVNYVGVGSSVARNPMFSAALSGSIIDHSDSYSMLELPINDVENCDPFNWGVDYDPDKIFGAGSSPNADDNSAGAEVIISGEAQLLRFDATVINNGRSLYVVAQIGSANDLLARHKQTTAEKDAQIFSDMEKDAFGMFRCKPAVNDIDSCWIETKTFTITAGKAGG